MSGTGKRLVNDFGQEEIRRKLKSLLVRGKGKITPGNYRADILVCLENAVNAGTLVRLKTRLWFWCFLGSDSEGREEWILLFMFRVVAGRANPLSRLTRYLLDVLPGFGYEIDCYDKIDSYDQTARIRALLPANISRTFASEKKRIQLIAHIGKFIVRKMD